jgi:hypothetical protein
MLRSVRLHYLVLAFYPLLTSLVLNYSSSRIAACPAKTLNANTKLTPVYFTNDTIVGASGVNKRGKFDLHRALAQGSPSVAIAGAWSESRCLNLCPSA